MSGRVHQRVPVEQHLARGGHVEGGEDAHGGALARAVGPDEARGWCPPPARRTRRPPRAGRRSRAAAPSPPAGSSPHLASCPRHGPSTRPRTKCRPSCSSTGSAAVGSRPGPSSFATKSPSASDLPAAFQGTMLKRRSHGLGEAHELRPDGLGVGAQRRGGHALRAHRRARAGPTPCRRAARSPARAARRARSAPAAPSPSRCTVSRARVGTTATSPHSR